MRGPILVCMPVGATFPMARQITGLLFSLVAEETDVDRVAKLTEEVEDDKTDDVVCDCSDS